MDSKIKVDLLVRGDLNYADYVTRAIGGNVLYCVSQEHLDERCDISSAVIVDGDMHVGSINSGSRTIVVMGDIKRA